jgi:hypothetical protein
MTKSEAKLWAFRPFRVALLISMGPITSSLFKSVNSQYYPNGPLDPESATTVTSINYYGPPYQN